MGCRVVCVWYVLAHTRIKRDQFSVVYRGSTSDIIVIMVGAKWTREDRMGRNINLVNMVGAPETVTCPGCGATVTMWFCDLDVDNRYTNPAPQTFVSSTQCSSCDTIVEAKIRVISVVEHVWHNGAEPTVPLANVEWQQRIDRSWIAVIGNRVSPAVMRLLPLFDDKWSIEVTCAGQRLAPFTSIEGVVAAKAKAVELLREHIANELRFLVGVDAILGASTTTITEQTDDDALSNSKSTEIPSDR